MNIPLDKLLSSLAEGLDVDAASLSPSSLLSDIPEFDSVGRLGVIAMCDSRFGFVLNIAELDACVTVHDFHSVVQNNATRLG